MRTSSKLTTPSAVQLMRRVVTPSMVAGVACTACLLSTYTAFPANSVETLRPERTINLYEIIQQNAGGSHFSNSDFRISGIGCSKHLWAVVVHSIRKESLILNGDLTAGRLSLITNKHYNGIAVDEEGQIHLQESQRGAAGAPVSVIDHHGRQVRTYSIPSDAARPFVTDGRVSWWTHKGPASERAPFLPQSAAKPIIADPNEGLTEYAQLRGLRSGQYLAFNPVTEVISIYDNTSQFLGSARPDLDSAYAQFGRRVPKKLNNDPRQGDTRVIWTATAADGLMYVCLSGLPASGPAPIAVFQPQTGSLVSAFYAELPTSSVRKSEWNPMGVITPSIGVIGDRLFILDKEAGVLVLYRKGM